MENTICKCLVQKRSPALVIPAFLLLLPAAHCNEQVIFFPFTEHAILSEGFIHTTTYTISQ